MAEHETWRLFIAIFPPPQVAQRLGETVRVLQRGLSLNSVAWTAPEKMHLTMNFPGNVERAKVEELARTLETVCARGQPHLLQTRGLGCFPSDARPRVIWAGLAGALADLKDLKRTLDEDLAKLGYATETRPFRPHLTLGRVKQSNAGERRHLASVLPQWIESDFGPLPVERVDLMKSTLSGLGAEYERIHSCPLRPLTGA